MASAYRHGKAAAATVARMERSEIREERIHARNRRKPARAPHRISQVLNPGYAGRQERTNESARETTMTFQRIDLLPRYDPAARNKVQSRWEHDDGRSLCERVIEKIRKGAGEDFLQWDFEQGRLGFLEDYWDLAGIQLSNEDITFPTGDNFENIDFSYAKFWHCVFVNATFPQTHFSFAKLYNRSSPN
jgi:Pentapeptide repeats (8 copies)